MLDINRQNFIPNDFYEMDPNNAVSIITLQFLEGDYRFSHIWNSLVEANSKTRNVVQHYLDNVLKNTESNKSNSDSLNEYIFLGIVLAKGPPEFRNYDKAIGYLERAVDAGSTIAMSALGSLYCEGMGVDQNFDMAIELYHKAIDIDDGVGSARAMFELGHMHMRKIGVALNYDKAVELYKGAININAGAGSAWAMPQLGYLYHTGVGVRGGQNIKLAIDYYNQGIESGDHLSMYNRACMHREGVGGPINYPEAIRLYEMAIKAGETRAMYYRACMHADGLGGNKNPAEAILLYERVIERGFGSTRIESKNQISGIYQLPDSQNAHAAEMVLDLVCKERQVSLQTMNYLEKYHNEHPKFQELLWIKEMKKTLLKLNNFSQSIDDKPDFKKPAVDLNIQSAVETLSQNLNKHFDSYLAHKIDQSELADLWINDIAIIRKDTQVQKNLMQAQFSWSRVIVASLVAALMPIVGWIGLYVYSIKNDNQLGPFFFGGNRLSSNLDAIDQIIQKQPEIENPKKNEHNENAVEAQHNLNQVIPSAPMAPCENYSASLSYEPVLGHDAPSPSYDQSLGHDAPSPSYDQSLGHNAPPPSYGQSVGHDAPPPSYEQSVGHDAPPPSYEQSVAQHDQSEDNNEGGLRLTI